MDAGEVTRKSRSLKSKKKGGKGTQAISAEDEAKRREAVKEQLRQKLELECKARQVVERLLEDSVTEEFLIDCAWHITPANYKDTVEERSIAKLCGYPTCPNKLTNVPTQQYKISTKTNRVYDITERKCFCSNFCYKASKSFELQISKIPLWLRKEESPPEIKLMKQGDGGSSGEEIKLIDKPITEADIDNPIVDILESNKDFMQSENSDAEQDFVSSVVSNQHKQVHWGKLPKRDEVSEDAAEYSHPEPEQRLNGDNKDENESSQAPQPQSKTSDSPALEKNTSENEIKGTLELLNQTKSTQQEAENTSFSPPENKISVPVAGGLNITQVGMSKRSAAGLKSLLKEHHKAKTAPTAISQCLLERLGQAFMEWRTEETMRFLYGPDYASGMQPSTAGALEEEEEDLDEDDLDEAEVGVRPSDGGSSRPSAPVPDVEKLRKETEMLELRVKEFYKGVCVLPEEVETAAAKDSEHTQDSGKDPPLPLVDSHAQHQIQKRIVVEKLSHSLRDIVGPLRLTMSDVINDVNNLVRTFRFTNTNIIHKSPEWTLIAVVLLSVLTEVSPLLRESLASVSSLEYISCFMNELKLEEKDLHNLVLLFKPCVPSQT
ncbi:putative RNA polymerase II subunit B1 CTD phosphatase rpap2 [Danio aesculapii]|uniref:putative RNA polymerase II subunit B1 CTD phosphatase rpap2 n=1 Tax=Danio aesculapii TaxID=1142201 RepID=UPI0024C00DE9|nr:putative RNA polymerase II subunit B1 CTD phosphatase rpap2 [Danio aesculapii]